MYAGLEPVIDKIITELKANLPTELAARAGGPPALEMPAPQDAEYTYGERQIHTTYPAIEVFPVTTPVDKDNGATLTTRGNVGIAIFVESPSEENIARLVERYGWAVFQVLSNRRAAGAFAAMNPPVSIDMNDQEFDWSPTRVAQRSLFQRDVMFAIRATKGESRT